MSLNLNHIEARILGSLVEKQLTTPEYYPLTLNALINACNQKSNREPVMSLNESEALAAIDSLRDKNLVYLFYGSGSRTVKYKHMLASVYELEPPAVAVLALLLLRGPQTVGELRGRSDRLFEFSGLGEVQETLGGLAKLEEPFVVKLERQPGQKDARYAHLLSGEIDTARNDGSSAPALQPSSDQNVVLEQRITKLEADLAALQKAFEEFRGQFG